MVDHVVPARIPESEIMRTLGLKEERTVVGYARVSSTTQKDDLERQKQLIADYAKEKGYGEIKMFIDIGSGLNENRKNFLKLLEMVTKRKVSKVIVAYKDRLTRFGFETLNRMFQAFGTAIEVINHEEKTPRGTRRGLDNHSISLCWKALWLRSHKYEKVVEGVRKLVG